MKKMLLFSLFAVLVAFTAFGIDSQYIYPVDSEIHSLISDIYLTVGRALPSATGPWSEAELMAMISEVPKESIPKSLMAEYDLAMKELSSGMAFQAGGVNMDFATVLDAEFYAHTNAFDGPERSDRVGTREKLFVGRENWSYDLVHEEPFLNFGFRFSIEDRLLFHIDLPIKSGFHNGIGHAHEIGSAHAGTNLPFLPNMGFGISFDPNIPYRAYASFGGRNWNAQIGRDRLSWGLGKTGNMTLDDNIPYYDMARFTTFSRSFKFTFLISTFPHKSNYYRPKYSGSDMKGLGVEKNHLTGLSLYLAHRLEGRFLHDSLSVSMTEAIMYASESGDIDFRIFNPSYVFHNLYIPSDSNSSMSLELNWTPIKGFTVYGQLYIDDFAIPGEAKPTATTKGNPNAMGYLAGILYMTEAMEGLISLNLEGAYTNPYTYLRYLDSPSGTDPYGLDYVVSTRTYISSSLVKNDAMVYDEYILGYKYGPDCIVGNLNLEYRRPLSFSVFGNMFFMAHGSHDKWPVWRLVGGTGQNTSPTDNHGDTGNYRYEDVDDRDSICYTFDLGLGGSFSISEKVSAHVQVDFMTIWNAYNVHREACSDVQLVLGAKYRL